MVPRPASPDRGHLEGVGQLGRDAGLARRPGEPAGRDGEEMAGFVTVCGDRHSFWAGLAAKGLPPAAFQPVGVAFVTGSVSAPSLAEAYEHRFPKDHPLRPLYVADREGRKEPAVNLLLH